MGDESALRELRARSLKDLPVGDKEARSLLARQALFLETQDASVLGDPETMLTAAQVPSAAFARPGDVLRDRHLSQPVVWAPLVHVGR